jgi:hypothetical protein
LIAPRARRCDVKKKKLKLSKLVGKKIDNNAPYYVEMWALVHEEIVRRGFWFAAQDSRGNYYLSPSGRYVYYLTAPDENDQFSLEFFKTPKWLK